MPEPLRILLVFVLAAIPSVALCRLVMVLRIMDAPTEARKIQAEAVPSAGGLAIAGAMAIALVAVAVITGLPLTDSVLVASAGGLAAMALGLADDILRIRATPRLLLMLVIALGVTVAGMRADAIEVWPGMGLELPAVLGVAGSVLWLLVVINAVNFMDGANGVSMGMAAMAAAGLAASAAFIGAWNVALLASALAGALAGFLVWNVAGRLFVGDTGALAVGAVLGALSLELVRLRPDLVLLPPLLLLPFLSDVLLTLFWRMKHGKSLFTAHRDHTYQIAMKAGLRHWQVALVHAVWALNAAAVAAIAALAGGQVATIAFLVVLAISIWLHLWIRRSGVRAGLVGANIP
jgi:UDP-N-acetylmuramyl pentapeptide phosphotransferase/UDP-N-acetylglucosamine-1-phosphate transferase